MAMFVLVCKTCEHTKKVLMTKFDEDNPKATCKCGAKMTWKGNGLSASVKEILDNGSMSRSLERFADAERLYAERAAKADPLAGVGKAQLTDLVEKKGDTGSST